MAGKKPPRRGKRVVSGYIISMSGELGGPWDKEGSTPKLPKVTKIRSRAYVWNFRDLAKSERDDYRRNGFPDAKVFPLVRYKLDPEEERLRDAVVEVAMRWAEFHGRRWPKQYQVDYDQIQSDMSVATGALRAHLEKKR